MYDLLCKVISDLLLNAYTFLGRGDRIQVVNTRNVG